MAFWAWGSTLSAAAPPPRDLLHAGIIPVQVMELKASPRLEELGKRFQAAVQSDPGWWADYLKAKTRPGERLPYDPKMGITQAEYEELQTLSDEMRMAPAAESEIAVRAQGDERFVLDGGKDLPELTGIVVDLGKDRVETKYGVARESSEVKASAEQKVSGPWSGTSWKLSESNSGGTTGTSVNFSLGRLLQGGKAILYYNARRVVNGKIEASILRVLTYSPAAAPVAKP